MLTLENWNDILYLALSSKQSIFISITYLISWIFLGNFLILNLFLAILLDGFTTVSLHESERDTDFQEKTIKKMKEQEQKQLVKKRKEDEEKIEFLKKIENYEFL